MEVGECGTTGHPLSRAVERYNCNQLFAAVRQHAKVETICTSGRLYAKSLYLIIVGDACILALSIDGKVSVTLHATDYLLIDPLSMVAIMVSEHLSTIDLPFEQLQLCVPRRAESNL